MAYTKRVANQIYKIEDSAIRMYADLIECIKGYVPKKYSIEEVWNGKAIDGTDIEWLSRAYKRICNFAEEARLKQMPLKLDGEGLEFHKHFTVVFPPGVNPNGNGSNGNGRESVLPKELSS